MKRKAKAPFRKRCHQNLVRLPLHIVFVMTPICKQPRRLEMNRMVLLLLDLAALVSVGYALPGSSEKRRATELEAHVSERLSNQVLEEYSRSRRSNSDSSDSSDSDDDDDNCDVVAVIAGLPALTSAAMTCATNALCYPPSPPPITAVHITALISCALDLLTNVVIALSPCLG